MCRAWYPGERNAAICERSSNIGNEMRRRRQVACGGGAEGAKHKPRICGGQCFVRPRHHSKIRDLGLQRALRPRWTTTIENKPGLIKENKGYRLWTLSVYAGACAALSKRHFCPGVTHTSIYETICDQRI